MSRHLSEEQISRWILGERATGEVEHASECPSCRAEIARLESAMATLRGSLRSVGEQSLPPAVDWARASRRPWLGLPVQWLVAAAALLLLTVVSLYHSHEQRRKAELARADAILLEQVDAGISRPIAEPMEPLARLMTWETVPGEGTNQ
jgi:hypothetical protein